MCPECGMPMRIYLIVPDGPGRDRRTYICDACKHAVTMYVVRTFRTLVWQFKRVSGSSGLKVQAAIAC